MIDTILSAFTSQLKDIVAQNPVTEKYNNDHDIKLLSDALQDVFKQEIQRGNKGFIQNLFNGEHKDLSNPGLQELCSYISASLKEKGMPLEDALALSQNTVPQIFNQYNHQITEAKSKGIDIPQIIDDVLSGKFNYSDMGKLMSLSNIFMKGKNSFFGKWF